VAGAFSTASLNDFNATSPMNTTLTCLETASHCTLAQGIEYSYAKIRAERDLI
jgi:hypothetical protein